MDGSVQGVGSMLTLLAGCEPGSFVLCSWGFEQLMLSEAQLLLKSGEKEFGWASLDIVGGVVPLDLMIEVDVLDMFHMCFFEKAFAVLLIPVR